MKYQIQKYSNEHYKEWNNFVAHAKNATFLFHRDFMEYHQDRFEDYSLLVFDKKNNLKAILPANRVGDVLYSHQGLTYGGLVLNKSVLLSEVIQITHSVLRFLSENKIRVIELKVEKQKIMTNIEYSRTSKTIYTTEDVPKIESQIKEALYGE